MTIGARCFFTAYHAYSTFVTRRKAARASTKRASLCNTRLLGCIRRRHVIWGKIWCEALLRATRKRDVRDADEKHCRWRSTAY